MEINIMVTENEKEELDKFIETCKAHGMTVTREGGGNLPNFECYYAALKGERWQEVGTGDRQLTIPDVNNLACKHASRCTIRPINHVCSKNKKCFE